MKSKKTICFCIPAWKPKEENDQEKPDDESHSSSRRRRSKRKGEHVVSTAHNNDHGEGNTGTAHETRPAKARWGELDEDDGDDLDFLLLPPKEVIGPNENGVKKVIEYKFNEEGKKVKITTTVRTRKVAKARLSKQAVERRSWAKFGEAVNENVGESRTLVSTEEIQLERPKAPGSSKAAKPEPLAPKNNATYIKCRYCKGEHWTSSCPHKDLFQDTEVSEVPVSDNQTPEASKTTYVPPGLRARADKTEVRPRRDENSVRVTNLSEDTREPDLRELFLPFGEVSRVYVALDKETQVSRGFGFVNFLRREDAQKAINKLNGYGYDNLILSVEWAAPRPN
ncbi:eukaryotic translation initiation factor 3 subunit G [Rosa sericea]